MWRFSGWKRKTVETSRLRNGHRYSIIGLTWQALPRRVRCGTRVKQGMRTACCPPAYAWPLPAATRPARAATRRSGLSAPPTRHRLATARRPRCPPRNAVQHARRPATAARLGRKCSKTRLERPDSPALPKPEEFKYCDDDYDQADDIDNLIHVFIPLA